MADALLERVVAAVGDGAAAIRPGTIQDRAQATKTGMQTEVFPLTLFALGGMMIATSAPASAAWCAYRIVCASPIPLTPA